MPGESHLLHTPQQEVSSCRAASPPHVTALGEGLGSLQRNVRSSLRCAHMYSLSAGERGANRYSAPTMSLLHRLRSICIASKMTFTVDAGA